MNILQIIYYIFLVVLTLLLGLAGLVLHRIGTIRKWEIEEEKKRRDGK